MEPNQESPASRQSTKPTIAAMAVGVVLLLLIAAAKFLAPIAAGPVQYKPETFRQDIASYIAAERYERAAKLLDAADVEAQVAHDLSAGAPSYLMIVGIGTTTPGIANQAVPNGWRVPGTSDAGPTGAWIAWNRAVLDFAKRYNLALKARLDNVKPGNP